MKWNRLMMNYLSCFLLMPTKILSISIIYSRDWTAIALSSSVSVHKRPKKTIEHCRLIMIMRPTAPSICAQLRYPLSHTERGLNSENTWIIWWRAARRRSSAFWPHLQKGNNWFRNACKAFTCLQQNCLHAREPERQGRQVSVEKGKEGLVEKN